MAEPLKANDRVKHLPTGLCGIVEIDPQSTEAAAVRIDHVPPEAWFPQYGRPRMGWLMAFPQVELERVG